MKSKLDVIELGMMDYQDAYQIQLELLNKRANAEINDTLILVEHPPVFTIGRGGSKSNILIPREKLKEKGIKVHEIDRGGDITYHGPGQIVGYPILNLKDHKQDLHWLMRSYEEVFIKLLNTEFDISADRISGLTGVWVDNKKITAIGIGVKHWITFHGFAFNVCPALDHFNYIIPCGITDKGVTSLEKLKTDNISFEKIKNLVIKYFCEVFNLELIK